MDATLLEPPPLRAPESFAEELLADVPHAEVPPDRPRRYTPIMRLPVPGDSDPADAPTHVGDLADRLEAILSQWLHPGLIIPSARSDTPPGWLTCSGQAISRGTYAALFDAIGVAYGAGDGSTTFNVPNLAGRFPWGHTAPNRGQAGGLETVALSVAEMPVHDHGVYDPGHVHLIADPGHVHLPYEELEYPDDPQVGFMHWRISGLGTGLTKSYEAIPYHFLYTAPRTRGSGTGIGIHGNATGIQLYGQGAGWAHTNMPPYQIVVYLIKT
ncbi:MAG: phage tail protein [Thermoplasmata archaeon]|nr:phage tail protein [Thermoplasmata archaeon]